MSDIDDELFALAGGDEEAEEGEASSVAASSPNSLGSGAMDESDSDNDEPNESQSRVPYPLEGKYVDEADKKRIEALPVLERESILGERSEETQQHKFNAELARRAKEREVELSKVDKKRKASSIEPEDAHRKSSRPKTKTSEKLEAYKREREQRGQLRKRQDDRRRHRRSSSGDRVASDVDAEGESEVEWDEQARKAAPRVEMPANLNHFEAVRVGRFHFQKVCFYPGFQQAMIGTFARIGVGQDENRRTIYKMAQIKGFAEGKPYVFEGRDGKKSATDQYVVVQHGSGTKEFSFNCLSNQSFTENDLETYKRSMAESNSRIPSRAFLERKYRDIQSMDNISWTEQAITEKLNLQQKYEELLYGANGPKKIVNEAAERLEAINRQNRKMNSEQIRKALIAERHAELRARKMREIQRKKEEAEKAAKLLQPPSNDIDRLFNGSDRSRSGTPAVKPSSPARKERTGIPTFSKRKMDDDILTTIDIGIDIDI